jgi:hypothetical protein
VPEKSAPRAERVAALKDLMPESGLVSTLYVDGMKSSVNLTSLMLRDGTRVEDPQDLLPAMEPRSAAPTYVESYKRAFDGWLVSSTVQSVMVVGGVVLLVSALAVPDASLSPSFSVKGVLALAGLSSFVLSWVPYLVARILGSKSDEERTSAFNAYPSSLIRRLDLEGDDVPPPPAPHTPLPRSALLLRDAPLRLALLPR